MPKKKKTVDIIADRKIIRAAGASSDWAVGESFPLDNGAIVHHVLTEPNGAPMFEFCLPHHARFVREAAVRWPAALDELERLRAQVSQGAFLERRADAIKVAEGIVAGKHEGDRSTYYSAMLVLSQALLDAVEHYKTMAGDAGDKLKRCASRSPGGSTEDGQLPRQGAQCGLEVGHDGEHSVLIPTGYPWAPKPKGPP